MASEQARDLRTRGIALAKAGQKEEARQLLQQSLRLEPRNEAAWLWLASVARDSEERRFSLEKLLEINPNNEPALKALSGVQPDAVAPLKRINEPKPKSTTGEIPAAQDVSAAPSASALTVPTPTSEKIVEAQRRLDAVIRDVSAPLPTPVRYVKKTRRRAGESDIVVYRLYLTAGAVGLLVVVVFLFVLLITTNDDAREVVFGPSPTNTQTPSQTWTPTPGVTPTPSAQPAVSSTPSPEIPPGLTPFSIYNLPRPTAVYPPLLDRAQAEAVAAVFRGDVNQALPTLEAARELSAESVFDAVPYYYETLALIERGDFNRALNRIAEGEELRLERAANDSQAQAIIDAGYAQVYSALALQAERTGDSARAQEFYEQMVERATAAIETDQLLAAPYLLVARYLRTQRNSTEAIRVLNQGLNEGGQRNNADFYMEKALNYADQGSYGDLIFQTYLTLNVDPAYEAAHLLRINAAFDRNAYSQAVLYAQDYLQLYPGSRRGFVYLGDAHRLEGSADLAIYAYSRGLAAPTSSDETFDLYVGRGRVYLSQRRYDEAADDLSSALLIQRDPAVQLLRMEAAYGAGSYDTVINDGQALASSSAERGQAALLHGRAILDQSPDQASAFNRALPLIETAAAALSGDARGTAYEYLARVQLGLGELDLALEAVDLALAAGETVDRRFVRGQILEAQDNTAGAILEYEWALTMSQIVPYANQESIEERLVALR